MTMALIATTTLASPTANITLSSIPATGTDLVLLLSLRDTTGGAGDGGIALRFNGDSGSNYLWKYLGGSGSGAGTGQNTASSLFSNNGFGGDPYAGSTANTFSNVSIYLPNYAGSTAKYISMDAVGETNGTTAYQSITVGRWTGTAAINSIAILAATQFATGSMASLYSVTKGSGGASVA